MEENTEMTAKQIPLSKGAKIDLRWRNFGIEFISSFLSLASGIGILSLSITMATLGEKIPIGLWIALGICIFIFVISSGNYLKTTRKNKKQVMEENFKDWQGSREVLSIIDYFKKNPPDLEKVDSPGLILKEGLIPVRLDYFPHSQIEGELQGTFSGHWAGLFVGTVGGTISGTIKGDSTPELTEQSAVAICVDEKGESFRLIFPSSFILRKNLVKYFEWLFGRVGRYSYTEEAISRLWKEGIRQIMIGLNAQRVVDHIAAKIALSPEERPHLDIKG